MNKDELLQLLNSEAYLDTRLDNTNAKADLYRSALEASYENDFPDQLSNLERIWKRIETDSIFSKENRGKPPFLSPILNFRFSMMMGIYPPPEILLCILNCFDRYLEKEGHISLDEAFFGRKYTKKSSQAFLGGKSNMYTMFKEFYVKTHFCCEDLKGKSEVELAKRFIKNHPKLKLKKVGIDDYDPETFLHGYRRWLRKASK